jgi:hypothetical protein
MITESELNNQSKFIPEIVIENYRGFAVRKAKKGFLAFNIEAVADEGGTVEKGHKQLSTRDTIEEAKSSVDRYFEWQAGYPEREGKRKEEAKNFNVNGRSAKG